MAESTDQLIRQLAQDVPAVRPLASLRRMLVTVLLCALPLSMVWVMSQGIRDGAFDERAKPDLGVLEVRRALPPCLPSRRSNLRRLQQHEDEEAGCARAQGRER